MDAANSDISTLGSGFPRRTLLPLGLVVALGAGVLIGRPPRFGPTGLLLLGLHLGSGSQLVSFPSSYGGYPLGALRSCTPSRCSLAWDWGASPGSDTRLRCLSGRQPRMGNPRPPSRRRRNDSVLARVPRFLSAQDSAAIHPQKDCARRDRVDPLPHRSERRCCALQGGSVRLSCHLLDRGLALGPMGVHRHQTHGDCHLYLRHSCICATGRPPIGGRCS